MLLRERRQFLGKAIIPMAVVQVKLHQMAVFANLHWGNIVKTYRASAQVAKFESFDAHG
jgi:hypothetical protein